MCISLFGTFPSTFILSHPTTAFMGRLRVAIYIRLGRLACCNATESDRRLIPEMVGKKRFWIQSKRTRTMRRDEPHNDNHTRDASNARRRRFRLMTMMAMTTLSSFGTILLVLLTWSFVKSSTDAWRNGVDISNIVVNSSSDSSSRSIRRRAEEESSSSSSGSSTLSLWSDTPTECNGDFTLSDVAFECEDDNGVVHSQRGSDNHRNK